MFIKIEISQEDLEAIEKSFMTVDEVFNSVKGRVCRAIINGEKILTTEPHSYGTFYVDGQKYDMCITKHKD